MSQPCQISSLFSKAWRHQKSLNKETEKKKNPALAELPFFPNLLLKLERKKKKEKGERKFSPRQSEHGKIQPQQLRSGKGISKQTSTGKHCIASTTASAGSGRNQRGARRALRAPSPALRGTRGRRCCGTDTAGAELIPGPGCGGCGRAVRPCCPGVAPPGCGRSSSRCLGCRSGGASPLPGTEGARGERSSLGSVLLHCGYGKRPKVISRRTFT